jgi:hypothetical protein
MGKPNFKIIDDRGRVLLLTDCAKSRLAASGKARSLRRSSSPPRTHYVGLRAGLGREKRSPAKLIQEAESKK